MRTHFLLSMASSLVTAYRVDPLAHVSTKNSIQTVMDIISTSKQMGVVGLNDAYLVEGSRFVSIEGRKMLNFGSCSYLGLESDEELAEGAASAALKYGTQFSVTRTFASHTLFQDLHAMLHQIFGKPTVVGLSTTLCHLAALPNIINEKDAVLMDIQVHQSVQVVAEILKARGIRVSFVAHNHMKSLDHKVKRLKMKFERIWYLCDGVYSVGGEPADFDGLSNLLDKHKELYLYIDDAHGSSWYGTNGCGVAHSALGHHDRVAIAISLNKSFGCTGGAVVLPNEEQASLVSIGAPMVFSFSIPPPMLGALCASMKLHLSTELVKRQSRLMELIQYCHKELDRLGVVQAARNDSPIFFIPVGTPGPTLDLAKGIHDEGFFVTPFGFPATAIRRAGIRFTLNYHIQEEDISKLVETIKRLYEPTIMKYDSTCLYSWSDLP
jgi:7-keto-8-aminopelargonate synthetase-like enzyme